jgi:hypothetical protein
LGAAVNGRGQILVMPLPFVTRTAKTRGFGPGIYDGLARRVVSGVVEMDGNHLFGFLRIFVFR